MTLLQKFNTSCFFALSFSITLKAKSTIFTQTISAKAHILPIFTIPKLLQSEEILPSKSEQHFRF